MFDVYCNNLLKICMLNHIKIKKLNRTKEKIKCYVTCVTFGLLYGEMTIIAEHRLNRPEKYFKAGFFLY
jgi:hypothetical protein